MDLIRWKSFSINFSRTSEERLEFSSKSSYLYVMPQVAASPVQEPVVPSKISRRLMSVDALRGFDMFWIMAGDALVYAFNRLAHGGAHVDRAAEKSFSIASFLADQLDHADWAGFHFYDLIFPMFVFIMGVSMVFSLTKQIQNGGRKDALKRLTRRFVLLFTVALLYSGGFNSSWPDIRLLGVLNRIALCYFFGGLIFIFFKPKAMVAWAVALLVGYWAMMTFVPIRNIQLENSALANKAENQGEPKMAAMLREGKSLIKNENGIYKEKEGRNFSTVDDSPAMTWTRSMFDNTKDMTTAKFEPGLNVANHFDFKYLPGKKWDVYWDPEGILSTIPAIATCLLGAFAGLLLLSANYCDKWKLIYLFSFGVAAVILGFLWGIQFPVVKKIWTSSFVLVAGGYSAILLGTFYWMVDVMKWQTWCQPFVWMGMNSITIYVTSNAIGGFRKLAGRFVGGDVKAYFDTHIAIGSGDLLVAITGMLLAFLYVRFLYKRKIFLRL
jgi:predicted acyltransferase